MNLVFIAIFVIIIACCVSTRLAYNRNNKINESSDYFLNFIKLGFLIGLTLLLFVVIGNKTNNIEDIKTWLG